MQAPHLKPVTEASPMSPAQRLMRTQGADSTLAEQVITRELAERTRDGEALNMMMRGMVAMLRGGRCSVSRMTSSH